MGPVFLALSVSILIYVIATSLVPRRFFAQSSIYTQHMINRLRQQQPAPSAHETPLAGLAQEDPIDGPLVHAYLALPLARRTVPILQRAQVWRSLDRFLLVFLLIFFAVLLLCLRIGLLGVPLAAALTWLLAAFYLRRRICKRKKAFLDMFPDALDSIVRSVKSGYPLNAAIAIIGDNMGAPIGPEFKRVADETAYGWTLFEALTRLAERIDEPDVRFFTVVLAVQQESGGNLSEVLSNLSHVLRKRRQLRLKILALSSEGRATAWILGSLPFFVFTVIQYASPEHLRPLFDTHMGHMIVMSILTMITVGMLIVRRLINMEV